MPPSAEEIDAALNVKLLASEVLQSPPDEAEADLANALLVKYGADHLAAAIVRLTRANDSAPEILQDPGAQNTKPPGRDTYDPDRNFPREPRREHGGRRGSDFPDGQWIKLGVGRKKKADPKWLIPMLCKSGGFSRNSIGAIRIGSDATFVELKPEAAARLMEAAGERQIIDKSIWVGPSEAPDAEVQKTKKAKAFKKNGPRKVRRPSSGNSRANTPQKNRTGPKKPRGPSGEKKRSKKKISRT